MEKKSNNEKQLKTLHTNHQTHLDNKHPFHSIDTDFLMLKQPDNGAITQLKIFNILQI